ncbi:reverse transcriptase [Corchorus capsularis]|uniref:Reverse transcriptase n=1 Tax=Corchorus capsularis TaxID=210143 RepID=A0A1R3FYU3_COCAP|nr:reverse transcriptase [Corchorus capsularis]
MSTCLLSLLGESGTGIPPLSGTQRGRSRKGVPDSRLYSLFMADLGESQGGVADELIVELEVSREEIQATTEYGLIGKVIVDRILNKRGVMNVLQAIWPIKVLQRVFDLGPNLYGFSFADRKSMELALSCGPWTVIGYCLCLQRWDASKAVTKIQFNTVNYWVQVHNLPLEFMTYNNAKKIGENLGSILEIENPDWVRGYGRSFIRIRIAVDLKKPLISSCERVVKPDGIENGKSRYGPWMRVEPVRGSRKEEEVKVVQERAVPELPYEQMEAIKNGRAVPELTPEEFEAFRAAKENCNPTKPGNVRRNLFKGKEKYDREALQELNPASKQSGKSLSNYHTHNKSPNSDHFKAPSSSTNPNTTSILTELHQIPFENPSNCLTPKKRLIGNNSSLTLEDQYSLTQSPSKKQHNLSVTQYSHQSTPPLHSPTSSHIQFPMVNLIHTPSPKKRIVSPIPISLHENQTQYIPDITSSPAKRLHTFPVTIITDQKIHYQSSETQQGLPIFDEYMVEPPDEEDEAEEPKGNQDLETVVEETISQQLVPVLRGLSLKRQFQLIEWEEGQGERMKARQIEANETRQKLYNEEIVVRSHQANMRHISWNCQGIGPALTVEALHELKRDYSPQLMFLMETKNREDKLETLRRKLRFNGKFYVEPEGIGRGLALWWNEQISVELIGFCKYMIDVIVKDEENDSTCRIFWVHGPTDFEERQFIWNMIVDRGKTVEGPWMCAGDFNDILYHHEKEGGNLKAERKIKGFRSMIERSSLIDLNYHGQKFTWINRRDNMLIKERIDRALVNLDWMETYPKSQVFNLPIIGSDHSPLLIDTNVVDGKATKLFKFEVMWTESPECKMVIKDGWSAEFNGSRSFQLVQKLKKCKRLLIDWSRKVFPNNKKAIDELKKKVAEIQDKDVSEQCCAKAEELIKEIGNLFFHQSTIQRRQRNKILKLKDSNGDWIENEEDIQQLFKEFYSDLFRSDGNSEEVLDCIPNLVSDEMNDKLTAAITEAEIETATFELGTFQAPGPDGYNGVFNQKYWSIVKEAVIKAVRGFFESGNMLKEINTTNLVVIPKVKKPDEVGQFRPIGCCNFIYKVISKVLVNRLKPFMDDLITPNQSAFIAGRQIQDNIIIANEVFHYLRLKKKGKKADMALKIDMNMAYDKVEWGFLEAVMNRLGFARRWVHWIVECVSSTSFNILFNGKRSDVFFPSRGLRQGDPLSPYLFLFVIDVLSRIINKSLESGTITEFICILQIYSAASGQAVNFEKSCVVFSSNTNEQVREELAQFLQIPAAEHPGTYLGIPSFWGKTKCEAMKFIKERVVQKVKGWKQNLLTQAGREILIKSVATAVPLHTMQCFKIPKRIFEEVIKGLYYPNATILTARKGGKASWTWTAMLEEIRNKEDRSWQLDSIRALIMDKSADAIEMIPLGSEMKEDRLIWPFNSDGRYSVKSGYHSAKDQMEKQANRSSSSSHIVNDNVWRSVWKTTGPNKVRNFLWKAVINRLPTAEGLWKRRINNSPMCPICQQKEETTEHALLLSDWTEKVWFGMDFGYKIDKRAITTFDAWFEKVIQNAGGWLKLNCDGAFDKASNEAGIGVIIRDDNGRVVQGCNKTIKAKSATCAEALAVYEGLKLARNIGAQRLIVETDCQLVYQNAISIRDRCWEIEPISEDIKNLLKDFQQSKMRWISRTANQAADWVACQARKKMCPEGWVDQPPSSLVYILSRDGLPAPPL